MTTISSVRITPALVYCVQSFSGSFYDIKKGSLVKVSSNPPPSLSPQKALIFINIYIYFILVNIFISLYNTKYF